ncbi:phage tail protein [Microbacterium resistens]
MASQVAVAEVAVVPTFKGFRKTTNAEAESAATSAGQGFRRIFSKTGSDSGKAAGQGFKAAFEGSAKGASDKVTKQLEADVAKASRALSTARLKEQDAIGKVRVAQAQLNEANKKYAQDSSQVIRAQERLAKASRDLERDHKQTESATDDLKRAQGELARAADRAGDELSEAGSKGVNGFRSSVIGGVKSFAGPLIAAFAALGIGSIAADAFREAKDFVTEAITQASDLEQSVGGVDAVFKDQARGIHDWAEEAADAVGLSQSKYNEFATIVGAQLKNLGIPLDDLGGQTNLLIELGADLAAQYGGPTSDAVSALSSLLRGERDPIERYGVTMNEAAVKAEALSLGLVDVTQDADKVAAAQLRAELAQRKYNEAVEKYGEGSSQALSANATLISANSALETALEGTTGELTNQQKAQATLSLLMKQTADAQGAFARESDTLAGKQQRNTAAWENITTQLGTAFLPVATQVADVIGSDVLPVIAKMAEEEGPELAKSFADLIPSLTELAKELLPLLPDSIDAIVKVAPAFIEMLKLITPLLLAMTAATTDQNTVLSSFFALLSGDTSMEEWAAKLMSMPGPIGTVLRSTYDLATGIATWFGEIPGSVQAGVDGAIAWLQGLPQRALDAVGDLSGWLVDSGRSLMQGFLDGIEEMLGPIGDAVSGALDWLTGFFPHSPAKRGPLAGSGWTALRRSGQATWDQFVSGFDDGGDPPFPGFPGNGADPATGFPGGSGSAPAAVAGITQINNIAHMPPGEAVEATGQRLSSLARRARV